MTGAMKSPGEIGVVAREVAGQCIASRVRLLSRIVTRLYDDALRPFGAKVSQMNVLIAAACMGEAAPGDLGRALCMDKSTLSRNVDRMRAQGWIEAVPAEDGRSHRLRVTPEGERLLKAAYPAWQEAQKKARALLGREAVAALGDVASALPVRRAAGP